MSDETRALIVAGITGPFAIAVDRVVTWARNRRKDNAQADVTLGKGWQELVAELRNDIADLRGRVVALEDERDQERERAKALLGEVDRYRSIARSLLRHVLRLREALAQQGVEAPPIPPDIEDAMTTIDLPT